MSSLIRKRKKRVDSKNNDEGAGSPKNNVLSGPTHQYDSVEESSGYEAKSREEGHDSQDLRCGTYWITRVLYLRYIAFIYGEM